jgi:hypothetical protein
MSFTQAFESYAKWRLREMIEAKALYESPSVLGDLVTTLIRIELKGVRKTLRIDTTTGPVSLLWKQIAADYWQKWLWPETEIEINAVIHGKQGKQKVNGFTYRGSGLAYHDHGEGDFHIDHIATGLRAWRDFDNENDARLFILAMVQIAKENDFSWHLGLDEIQAKVVEVGNIKKKVDAAFNALLKAEVSKEAA